MADKSILQIHLDLWQHFYEEHIRELRNAEPGPEETKARNKAIAAEAVVQALKHYQRRISE